MPDNKPSDNQRAAERDAARAAGAPDVRASVPACSIARRCGGCQWLDLPYPEQLARKQQAIEELFDPYLGRGKVAHGATPGFRVSPILGMGDPTHYRTKVIAPFAPARAPKGERQRREGRRDQRGRQAHSRPQERAGRRPRTYMRYGMFERGTHRIVPVDACLVEDPLARPIVDTVARMAQAYGYPAYDEDAGRGLLRHVMVRTSRATRQALVTLVLTDRDMPNRRAFVKELVHRHPEVASVVINVNDRDTNAVLGDREVVVYGSGHIADELCGLTFKISSRSFFQTNPRQTEVLYATAMELAGLDGTQRVLDAYCGIGTIGLVAAGRAAQVTGVELNPAAARDARANARANGIGNAEFVCEDSTSWAVRAARAGQAFDVAFMDPPRAGSTPEFIRSLAGLAPSRIVYVSCGPTAQRRDIDLFVKQGYRLARMVPVDMFPHTPHIETVALLERKRLDD